jgi:serine/threonine-protein kinase
MTHYNLPVRTFAGLLLALAAGCNDTSTDTTTSSTSGGAATTTGGATTGGTNTGGSSGSDGGQNFPASSIIYQDVTGAALDPNSSTIITALNNAGGWGTANFQIDFSLAILHADSNVVPQMFTKSASYYEPDCDLTKVPLPPGGNAEGSTDYTCDVANNDCHILVYQGPRLYELYQATTDNGQASGMLTTTCEVVWDLTRDYWAPGTPYSRGDQCTSADAAGMPIAPLLVTGAELQAGAVNHAMRFTLPNSRIQANYYLHPGTHAGGPTGGSSMPIYVARFRLRSDFDLSTLPNQAARTIAQALKTYGMFLDDGGNVPLTIDQSASGMIGSHDLAALKVTDFEIVAAPDAPVPLTFNCQRTQITQ